jgi:LPXTG-motif cell wall-anchored protein
VVQVQVNVVIGQPCPLVGQRGWTVKKEDCSCKKTGSAPAEQPKWVLAANTPKADSLPVTGASTMWIAVAGGLVLLLGAGVFVVARRRRVRFSA